MINRGDIKLAIDMVVNAQDDSLWGGEAEYVINTLENCGNEIAKLRKALILAKTAIEGVYDRNQNPALASCSGGQYEAFDCKLALEAINEELI